MDLDVATIREAVIIVIISMSSLALHEWGHAAMADRLGDHTPRSQGRVTLNPLAHIDLVGTIIVPLLAGLGFFGGLSAIGWAKPVEYQPANLRNGYHDQALITLAGPMVNLVLAVLSVLGFLLTVRFSSPLNEFFSTCLVVNASLFVFNLLPIAPLDGSKFLIYFRVLSEEAYARFSAYGWIVLIVLINLPPFRMLLSALISGLIGILMLPYRLMM